VPAGDGAPTPAGRGQTILVVDDDTAVLRFLLKTLAQHGYAPIGASDPQRALHLAATTEQPIDLLIVDVIMPVIGGFRLAEMLGPPPRILYVSSYDRDDLGWDGAPGHIKAFLPKPITSPRLLDSVQTVLAADPPPVHPHEHPATIAPN
jgi:two-component system, cell cycle sensor histidine kinase and response regulator CckA